MTRHFIVGNGKSLMKTPLDLLEGEISWGMNEIYKMFPFTKWRPTHFVMVDHNTDQPAGYWRRCIQANRNAKKYILSNYRDGDWDAGMAVVDNTDFIGLGADFPNTVWIDNCIDGHHSLEGKMNRLQDERWYLPDEWCISLGGISIMMQGAVMEGATELYVLGCDLYSKDTKTRNENYFTEQYYTNNKWEDKMWDDDYIDYWNARFIRAHEVAREWAGIPIYNAGIGGLLEVHPRVDLLEVLNK